MKKSVRYFNPRTASKTRPSVLVACLLIAIVGTLLTFYSRAENFCDINPVNNNQAIDAALANCADGTTIRFPPNASYSVPDTIFVKDRHNLVVDGRGSTFTITTQGDTKPTLPNGGKNGGNWLVLRGSNITLKNIRAVGSFPLGAKPGQAGEPRSLARQNDPGVIEHYAEYMSNFGLYGVNGVYLEDLEGWSPWGDVVTSGPDTYIDGSTADYTNNVFIKRVHSESPSRHCWALTSGSNMWIEDSFCKDAWYGGTDQELDDVSQPMDGLHILRNRFEGVNLFGIYVPVAGVSSQNIEVKNNIFYTSTNNDKPCNQIIGVGSYPNNPAVFENVTIENNTLLAYNGQTAIEFDHVKNGSIKNNKITPISGGCNVGPPIIKVTNSTNVTQENNGPDAPGADSTVTPPPPTDAPPTVSLTSPPNGAVVSGVVGVVANASDNNGVAKVDFLVDGIIVSTDTSHPYGFNWNTAGLIGSHELSAKVTDTANQSVTSSAVTVSVASSSSSPTSCGAPTSFTGVAGPNGSGQYNFSWQPVIGATQYDIYYGNPPSTVYASGFTSPLATVYSLAVNVQYNFAVRAVCGTVQSVNSNALTITAPGNGTPDLCSNKALADVNCDGSINAVDISEFRQRYKTSDQRADLDGQNGVNAVDISVFRLRYKNGI